MRASYRHGLLGFIALCVLILAFLLLRNARAPEPPTASVPAAAEPPVAYQPAAEQRILFAGDSMMQGVAPLAISALKSSHPEWRFFDESRHSTGLTVGREIDWVAKIKQEVSQRQHTVVVIFLGPNDPWDIYLRGRHLRFPSDEWEAYYAEKVAEICEYLKPRNVRLVWIGLPVMKNPRVQQGAVIQDRVFERVMAQYGFDYLSTEELLGRLDQPFTRHIIDDQGQKRLMRAPDGIHFTPDGLRRISSALVERIEQAVARPPNVAPAKRVAAEPLSSSRP